VTETAQLLIDEQRPVCTECGEAIIGIWVPENGKCHLCYQRQILEEILTNTEPA